MRLALNERRGTEAQTGEVWWHVSSVNQQVRCVRMPNPVELVFDRDGLRFNFMNPTASCESGDGVSLQERLKLDRPVSRTHGMPAADMPAVRQGDLTTLPVDVRDDNGTWVSRRDWCVSARRLNLRDWSFQSMEFSFQILNKLPIESTAEAHGAAASIDAAHFF